MTIYQITAMGFHKSNRTSLWAVFLTRHNSPAEAMKQVEETYDFSGVVELNLECAVWEMWQSKYPFQLAGSCIVAHKE